MKKVVTGLAIGAGLIGLYKVLNDRGVFDNLGNSMNRFANKAKRNSKIIANAGKNQAEYLKERAEYGINKGKDKLKEMAD